ncbi:MAG: hypothetical protein ACRDF7_00040 [Candidatus Limnocylindrales bacterium]
MDTNFLFGYALLLVGVFAMASGVAISLIDAMRPTTAPESAIGDVKGLIEAITKALSELAKFKPGMQLVLVGALIFAGGAYLLTARPF